MKQILVDHQTGDNRDDLITAGRKKRLVEDKEYVQLVKKLLEQAEKKCEKQKANTEKGEDAQRKIEKKMRNHKAKGDKETESESNVEPANQIYDSNQSMLLHFIEYSLTLQQSI